MPILLDMTAVRGVVEGGRATGVVVPDVVRDRTYRADTFILATGGLYGGGITSDYTGTLREAVFGLPLQTPAGSRMTGSRRNFSVRPDTRSTAPGCAPTRRCSRWTRSGRVVLENVRVAGRLLAGYDPLAEGSTEGVWLATAYRAATADE